MAPGPDEHDEPADAGVADDEVRAAPDEEEGDVARAGVAHDAAQLEGVVRLGEDVGRPAHPQRGETGQRLVARGPDAEPALDVRAGGGASRRR